MGKKSQNVGALFEEQVKELNAIVGRRGQATIRRTKPPVNVVKRNRRGMLECVYSGEPSVDFQGILRGGQAVAFDAKTVDLDRFPFDMVEDSQLGFLMTTAAIGGCAFLLVERRQIRRVGAVYVLPVSGGGLIAGVAHKRSLDRLAPETRESVRFDTLDGWRVAPGETWFDVVRRQVESGEWARVMEVQWDDDTLAELEQASAQLDADIVEDVGAKKASKWRKGVS